MALLLHFIQGLVETACNILMVEISTDHPPRGRSQRPKEPKQTKTRAVNLCDSPHVRDGTKGREAHAELLMGRQS